MNTPHWSQIVKKYSRPSTLKSSWQLGSTLSLYVISWFVAYAAYQISLWHCLGVAIISQMFFGRLFIFMHDCGHGSFFKTKGARTFWGYVTGIIWATPYWQWTKAHATHHRNSGNLEHRGIGDIWTLTTKEYEDSSNLIKFFYRLCRFPPFVIGVGGLYTYFGVQRFFTKADGKRERRSVIITNFALVVMGIAISYATNMEFFLFYQFFLLYLGSCLAVFFFYVQHQYEDVYWSEANDWDYETAAMEGSSCLDLPVMIKWASGSIGFHHIHHLSHTIPNYNLERAMQENTYFQNPTKLNLWDCVKCFNLSLYDLDNKRMLTFSQYKSSKKQEKLNSLIIGKEAILGLAKA